jgi:hypothetical protein
MALCQQLGFELIVHQRVKAALVVPPDEIAIAAVHPKNTELP